MQRGINHFKGVRSADHVWSRFWFLDPHFGLLGHLLLNWRLFLAQQGGASVETSNRVKVVTKGHASVEPVDVGGIHDALSGVFRLFAFLGLSRL